MLPDAWMGLSPRVRGNLSMSLLSRDGIRSIPACAGEPSPSVWSSSMVTVYPRVCGGTGTRALARLLTGGLSPRVRGNPDGPGSDGAIHGSIPACAGEPLAATPSRCRPPVYPRVCGGTGGPIGAGRTTDGLSPRVRGNPWSSLVIVDFQRSIPACAGEPSASIRAAVTAAVYPRVCGGTPG